MNASRHRWAYAGVSPPHQPRPVPVGRGAPGLLVEIAERQLGEDRTVMLGDASEYVAADLEPAQLLRATFAAKPESAEELLLRTREVEP